MPTAHATSPGRHAEGSPGEAREEHRGARTDLENLGSVVSVRGSVVDVRFDERLPPVHSVLRSREG